MKNLLKYLVELWQAAGYPEVAGFITLLLAVMELKWKLISTFWQQRKQRKQLRDLHPFYTEQEKLRATQYYVETTCQNVAPSKEDEMRDSSPYVAKQSIIPFFLKEAFHPRKDDCQFYFVLADSGMGKTTFLINLYLRYFTQFVKPGYRIRLFPLGFPDIDTEIEKIPNDEKKNTILLLDAFDEDLQAVQDYKTRLRDLLHKVRYFREVVITCRTQFFPSEVEEPDETGILRFGPEGGSHVFHKFYLSPFSEQDIQTYLTQRFSWLQKDKRSKAQQIILSCPNLMVRPMLLGYIEDLLKGEQTYTSTYTVYAELINKWIERESHKVSSERREHYTAELYQFSREIALNLYRHREERQGSLMISSKEIQPFADRHGIQLSEMEMKSKSLLNRNAQGQYKFSHKSILEYFLAEEAFFNPEFRKELDFDSMSAAEAFFNEMIWEKLTVPFFSRGDVSGEYFLKDGKIRVLTKLSEKILSEIVYLKLTEWSPSDEGILLFRGLKHLKWLDVGEHIPAEHYAELQQMLPACQVFRYVSEHDIQTQFGLTPYTFKIGDSEYKGLRPVEYIHNTYEDKGDVVIDQTTHLMWQKSGSKKYLTYKDALHYVNILNQQQFAGHDDWRLPTIPELMSLLEPTEKNGDLYIDPIFDVTQRWCWSADKRLIEGGSSSAAWGVYFYYGGVDS